MGQALIGPLGPYGRALMGRAVMGRPLLGLPGPSVPGRHEPGPHVPPGPILFCICVSLFVALATVSVSECPTASYSLDYYLIY